MKAQITLVACLLLTLGCGGPADIHTVERESKAYETAAVESMDQINLMLHLATLANEMSLATRREAYAEMHHIEIALTKALAAIELQASPDAKPTIDTLKIIAVKIHGAGHDQNKSMAMKLDQTLRDQIDRLRGTLNAKLQE